MIKIMVETPMVYELFPEGGIRIVSPAKDRLGQLDFSFIDVDGGFRKALDPLLGAMVKVYVDGVHVFTGYGFDVDPDLQPPRIRYLVHDATWILMKKKISSAKTYGVGTGIGSMVQDLITSFAPELSISAINDSRTTSQTVNIANNGQPLFYVLRELGRKYNTIWYVTKDMAMYWRERVVGTVLETIREGQAIISMRRRKTLNDDGSITISPIIVSCPYRGTMRYYGDTVRVIADSYQLDLTTTVEQAELTITSTEASTTLELGNLNTEGKLEDLLYRPESQSGVTYT